MSNSTGFETPPRVDQRRLLLLIASSLVAWSLAPFDFSDGSDFQIRLREFFGFPFFERAFDFLLHFVFFAAAGCAWAAVQRKATGVRVVLVSTLSCLAVECLQLGLLDRHARLGDWGVNSLGFWLGATGVLKRLQSRRAGGFGHVQHRWCAFLQVGLRIVAAAAWVFAGLWPIPKLGRLDWGKDFRLVVGNEVDGTEPWSGAIYSIAVFNRALDVAEIRAAYQRSQHGNAPWQDRADLLVGYNLTAGGSNSVDAFGSLASTGLTLLVPPNVEWVPTGGVRVTCSSGLTSRDSAPELARAITETGAFSILAEVQDLGQISSPARLIGYSGDADSRNFMVGREDSDLLFRVRNGIVQENGIRHALRVRNAAHPAMTHIVATYDHGVMTVFRDGEVMKPVADLREPNVYLFLGGGTFSHVASAWLLLVLMAGSVNPGGSFWRIRHDYVKTALAVFVVGSLPYFISCILVGGPWRPNLPLAMSLVPLFLYPVWAGFVSGRRSRVTL